MNNPGIIRRGVLILVLALVSTAASETFAERDPLAWPKIERQHRPWAYWWWMGSAVDAKNITSQLETFQKAGLGGVHIIPIYGAKGYEDRYIDYLSPQWMAMLEHTVREAERLDMGVDMTTGTGWCFGGPSITDELANAFVAHETRSLKSGRPLEGKFDSHLQAIIAYAEDGQTVDLTDRVGSDRKIAWVVPAGKWQLMTVWQKPMRNVKRAAPGGEGRMLNTFYDRAIETYLDKFTAAFDAYHGPLPRGMYHDSYEYQCNWAPDILTEFENRRGYKLQDHLPRLLIDCDEAKKAKKANVEFKSQEKISRVRADYNRTLSELMLSDFLEPWVDWCHQRGLKTRNQAHGSPGNLLDLYAVADIPEAEMFRLDRDPLVAKFSSSAAHVVGRKLVANETGTWLRDHFQVTLGDLKQLVDEVLVSGINHVVYHGTCYSPAGAKWPGWVFYAATQMNPRNSIWRDAPALNTYIARCQSILQAGQPDNSVLLYWPIEDFWHSTQELAPQMTVHHVEWLREQAIGSTANMLWQRGYAFDYVSDLQLQETTTDGSEMITSSGNRYQVLVVPPCQHMPLATLKRLVELANNGASIIFEAELPADVPGLANLDARRAELKSILEPVVQQQADGDNLSTRLVKSGKGKIWTGELEVSLTAAGVERETIVDYGVKYIRRRQETGRHYFITNFGEHPLRDWVTLSTPLQSVIIMNPMTGKAGRAAVRRGQKGLAQIYLHLEPGESRILRTLDEDPSDGRLWENLVLADGEIKLEGEWQIEFITGGPTLPETITTHQLKSWTDLGGEETKRFAGTARYSLTFNSPDANSPAGNVGYYRLDLGDCRESARVSLNGHHVGTVIGKPFHVDFAASLLKPTENRLEVEVTNLSINRIADLDRRGVEWQIFHDINFVNIDYKKPFDASGMPARPAGLLEPIVLRPLQIDEAAQ